MVGGEVLLGLPGLGVPGPAAPLRLTVDLPEEADQAMAHGAVGVGLFRTEFLVVGRNTMPGEEEQYQAYKAIGDTFGGLPVVLRTTCEGCG